MSTTYEEGLQIRHQQYGLGTILETDEERTSIDFAEHGTKKFVTSMVTLEILADQPPRKDRKKGKRSRRTATVKPKPRAKAKAKAKK
ncbi:MAG: hypothetical protein ACE5HB_08445 [Terriglobia bacterium]